MKIGLVQFSSWLNFTSNWLTKRGLEKKIFYRMGSQKGNVTGQKTAPRIKSLLLFSDKLSPMYHME